MQLKGYSLHLIQFRNLSFSCRNLPIWKAQIFAVPQLIIDKRSGWWHALYSEFKISFDFLTMAIPHWVINTYNAIEESDIAIQERFIGLNTNKVEFKKLYTILASEKCICYLFWIIDNCMKIFDCFSIFISRRKWLWTETNLLTKRKTVYK